jgi:hypothetical protein
MTDEPIEDHMRELRKTDIDIAFAEDITVLCTKMLNDEDHDRLDVTEMLLRMADNALTYREGNTMSNINETELLNLRVLIEMPDEPDCRFIASWLTKAADAQAFWSEALDDPDFDDLTLLLHAVGIPDLAAGALYIIGEAEHGLGVVALALYPDDDDYGLHSREIGLLMRLGFFVAADGRYRLAIPEHLSLASVKQAALDVAATAGYADDVGCEVLQPERLLQTLPKVKAEAARETMLAMRRFRQIIA